MIRHVTMVSLPLVDYPWLHLSEPCVRGALKLGHSTCLETVASIEDNDNDNDNDTLREVPHQSNEGLALQARVSGPWPLKKESVLLGKLAHWQGVQVQTVMDRM